MRSGGRLQKMLERQARRGAMIGDEGTFRIGVRDANELVWLSVRKRPQEDSVYQGENSGVCADAEGEGKDGHDGKPRRLPQHA